MWGVLGALCFMLITSAQIPPVEIPDEPPEAPPINTPPVDLPPIEIPPIHIPPINQGPIDTPPLDTPQTDIPTSIPSYEGEVPTPDLPEVPSPDPTPTPTPGPDAVFASNRPDPEPNQPLFDVDVPDEMNPWKKSIPETIDNDIYVPLAHATDEYVYGGQAPYPAAADQGLADHQIFEGLYPRRPDEQAGKAIYGYDTAGQFNPRAAQVSSDSTEFRRASLMDVWVGFLGGKYTLQNLDQKIGMTVARNDERIGNHVEETKKTISDFLVAMSPETQKQKMDAAYEEFMVSQDPVTRLHSTVAEVDKFISRMNTDPKFLETQAIEFLQKEQTMGTVLVFVAVAVYSIIMLLTIRTYNKVIGESDNFWYDLGNSQGFMLQDVLPAITDLLARVQRQAKRRPFIEEMKEVLHTTETRGLEAAERVLEEVGRHAPYIHNSLIPRREQLLTSKQS